MRDGRRDEAYNPNENFGLTSSSLILWVSSSLEACITTTPSSAYFISALHHAARNATQRNATQRNATQRRANVGVLRFSLTHPLTIHLLPFPLLPLTIHIAYEILLLLVCWDTLVTTSTEFHYKSSNLFCCKHNRGRCWIHEHCRKHKILILHLPLPLLVTLVLHSVSTHLGATLPLAISITPLPRLTSFYSRLSLLSPSLLLSSSPLFSSSLLFLSSSPLLYLD